MSSSAFPISPIRRLKDKPRMLRAFCCSVRGVLDFHQLRQLSTLAGIRSPSPCADLRGIKTVKHA